MWPYITYRLNQTHLTPSIVTDSTPVLGFGDFLNASVATLGLNPSKNEFLDSNGQLLVGAHARLESLQSLAIPNMLHATSIHHRKILDGCLNYFKGNNPFSWFNGFNPFMQALGVSYQTGTACHLDLFQTATDPVWSKLPNVEKEHYIKQEGWFCLEQLFNHNIKKVLLNGRSVIKEFEALSGVLLHSTLVTSPCGGTFDFVTGTLTQGQSIVEVRGWSFNIQSGHGVTTAMCQRAAALC
jgi:hypothetical protein